ncbi:MAG TPA: selenocysteine-specific translation elongation factor [Dehalococcoidia bacterium]|nr:selenocysteine-specific translation elongation factor [Dehalococcoidia bacterium]
MFVVGTAGHVDHGKSALVRALTGIDPDRLQEEKERGMTIDLGFAWLSLPSGKDISIVDVPGHERFVNNMLAGVGSVDMAMLVVAADESIMPQTKEHLAILDLLNVKSGVIVITKKDLVDEEWMELVKLDVQDLIQDTVMANSPIYGVSSETREGINELIEGIDNALSLSNRGRDIARPRLAIDRSFSVSGFGTVVTGTLIDGCIEVGQELEIAPSRKSVKIRGLQTHKRKEEIANPGTRVAANISGIDQTDVSRGDVLTIPGWLRPSEAFDVHLKVLEDAPNNLRHNMFVSLHTGTIEIVSRLRLLEGDIAEPGSVTWAQIKPNSSVPVVKGDHFVLRSNMTTLGGGVVVDPHAKRHRRRDDKTIERLTILEMGTISDVLVNTIDSHGLNLLDLKNLSDKIGMETSIIVNEISALINDGMILSTDDDVNVAFYFTKNSWDSLVDITTLWLNEYHKEFPLRSGAPKEEIRNKLRMDGFGFNKVLSLLCKKNIVEESASTISLIGYSPRLSSKQLEVTKAYIDAISKDPFSPSTDVVIESEVLNFLHESGEVVKVADGVTFSAGSYNQMVSSVKEYINKNGDISVGDVRDLFHTSRKYALALVDYLDQQQVTRRVGDVRILR